MKTHNQRMTTVYWPLQLLLLFDESGWVGGWVGGWHQSSPVWTTGICLGFQCS